MNADGGVDPAHEVVVGGPGSPAFVGSVYYVAGADDVPVPEWPPQLPRAGILPSSSSSSSTTKTSTTTSSTSAPPPRTSKSLGASAYFLSKDLAERWRDVIRRPMGLRYCQRRRLFRPSDIPLGVVEVRRCSMGEAFGKLCVGWGNPVLATKMGFSADDVQMELASALVQGWGAGEANDAKKRTKTKTGDEDAAAAAAAAAAASDAVETAQPPRARTRRRRKVVGEGLSNALCALLTGYRFNAMKAPTAAEGEDPAAPPPPPPPPPSENPVREGAFIAREIDEWIAEMKHKTTKEKEKDDAGGGPLFEAGDVRTGVAVAADGSVATFRRAVNFLTRRRRRGDVDAGPDARPSGDLFTSPPRWRAPASIDDGDGDGDGEYTPDEYDKLLAAYADAHDGWKDPEHVVDKPVFSSSMIQVIVPMPADAMAANVAMLSASSKKPEELLAGYGDDGGAGTIGAMYRPWFFNLDDLTAMLHKAMESEARTRAARNKQRREKIKKTLAQMVTALANTRANPKLGGWAAPGLSPTGGGGGGGGGGGRASGGGAGFFKPGSDGDDDDEGQGEYSDDMDEDNEHLHDDDLMKEYMKEMAKDGGAEDMIGAWASAVQNANRRQDVDGVPMPVADKDKPMINLSPAAHFALVAGVTAYFGWSCACDVIGAKFDEFLCRTYLGRVALTSDTPYAVRLLPIRPRSRCERRFLRTFPVRRVVTLHPRFPFNVCLTGETFD